MSPVTHFFIGWATANCAPSLTRGERAFVALASVAPDVDGLGIVLEWATRSSKHPIQWWSQYHHTFGHNIGFALFLTVLVAIICRHKLYTPLLVFLSFHLHLLGDLVGGRGPDGDQWPIPYLLPFSSHPQLTWAGQWALNAWPNFVITAVLVGFTLLLACRRGFSPLEMLSRKADSMVVQTLRNRIAYLGEK